MPNCSGLTQSLPIVNYVDFYRKWWSAVQLRQSLAARDLARSHGATASAKSSIWSPAHDAERTNVSLSSNASLFDLPRCHGEQLTTPGCRHAMMSSPEAESILGKLLALSSNNWRSWNQLAAMSMYDTIRYYSATPVCVLPPRFVDKLNYRRLFIEFLG